MESTNKHNLLCSEWISIIPGAGPTAADFEKIFKPLAPFMLVLGFVVFAYGYWNLKDCVDGDNRCWIWLGMLISGIALYAYSCKVVLDV